MVCQHSYIQDVMYETVVCIICGEMNHEISAGTCLQTSDFSTQDTTQISLNGGEITMAVTAGAPRGRLPVPLRMIFWSTSTHREKVVYELLVYLDNVVVSEGLDNNANMIITAKYYIKKFVLHSTIRTTPKRNLAVMAIMYCVMRQYGAPKSIRATAEIFGYSGELKALKEMISTVVCIFPDIGKSASVCSMETVIREAIMDVYDTVDQRPIIKTYTDKKPLDTILPHVDTFAAVYTTSVTLYTKIREHNYSMYMLLVLLHIPATDKEASAAIFSNPVTGPATKAAMHTTIQICDLYFAHLIPARIRKVRKPRAKRTRAPKTIPVEVIDAVQE